MKKLLAVSDTAAICLSFLCAVHCLILPFLLVLWPTITSFMDERFHRWMVLAVVPISFFSLVLGLKRHKRYFALVTASAGLLLLIFSGYFGEEVLSEFWEETLTLVAAFTIATGHFYNFRLCQIQCQSIEIDTRKK